MSDFGKLVNHHKDSIISSLGFRKASDEVHFNVVELPLGNRKRLEKTGWTLMFCFHSSAYITFIHELGNLPFHACPPVRLLEVLIHLGTARMNGKERVMSFFHYELPEITFGNNESVLEEQGISLIKTEALIFWSALCNPMFHLLHHGITELGLTDLIFQGRSNLEICKKTLRNNLKVELPESFTKLRLMWLDKKAVAICLSAQSICNHIRLAWSVLNAGVVLLDHLDPTSLAEVQMRLCEDVLQALVISEDVDLSAQQQMSPRNQSMYHSC